MSQNSFLSLRVILLLSLFCIFGISSEMLKFFSDYELRLNVCFNGIGTRFKKTESSSEVVINSKNLYEQTCPSDCFIPSCKESRTILDVTFNERSSNLLDHFFGENSHFYSTTYRPIKSSFSSINRNSFAKVFYFPNLEGSNSCNNDENIMFIQLNTTESNSCYYDPISKLFRKCQCSGSTVQCMVYNKNNATDQSFPNCDQKYYIKTETMGCTSADLGRGYPKNNIMYKYVCNTNFDPVTPSDQQILQMTLSRYVDYNNDIKDAAESYRTLQPCIKYKISGKNGDFSYSICSEYDCDESSCYNIHSYIHSDNVNPYYHNFFSPVQSVLYISDMVKEIGSVGDSDIRVISYNEHRGLSVDEGKKIASTEYIFNVFQLYDSNHCYEFSGRKHTCQIIADDDSKQEVVVTEFLHANCTGGSNEFFVINSYQDWLCGWYEKEKNDFWEVVVFGIIGSGIMLVIMVVGALIGVGIVYLRINVKDRSNDKGKVRFYRRIKNLVDDSEEEGEKVKGHFELFEEFEEAKRKEDEKERMLKKMRRKELLKIQAKKRKEEKEKKEREEREGKVWVRIKEKQKRKEKEIKQRRNREKKSRKKKKKIREKRKVERSQSESEFSQSQSESKTETDRTMTESDITTDKTMSETETDVEKSRKVQKTGEKKYSDSDNDDKTEMDTDSDKSATDTVDDTRTENTRTESSQSETEMETETEG